jgi:hypothetical protein
MRAPFGQSHGDSSALGLAVGHWARRYPKYPRHRARDPVNAEGQFAEPDMKHPTLVPVANKSHAPYAPPYTAPLR